MTIEEYNGDPALFLDHDEIESMLGHAHRGTVGDDEAILYWIDPGLGNMEWIWRSTSYVEPEGIYYVPESPESEDPSAWTL